MGEYEYELRHGGEVIATGRLQLERRPESGDTLDLGSRTVRVVEVLDLRAATRLILAD